MGLLVAANLVREAPAPKGVRRAAVFSSKSLILRYISIALVCSGPSTTKNKSKREIKQFNRRVLL